MNDQTLGLNDVELDGVTAGQKVVTCDEHSTTIDMGIFGTLYFSDKTCSNGGGTTVWSYAPA